MKFDEWCTECKEFDLQRKCCQRFNRVIRETAEELHTNVIEDLQEIYQAIWEIDIPSPTVPEYVEHHNQMQELMKLVTEKTAKYKALGET